MCYLNKGMALVLAMVFVTLSALILVFASTTLVLQGKLVTGLKRQVSLHLFQQELTSRAFVHFNHSISWQALEKISLVDKGKANSDLINFDELYACNEAPDNTWYSLVLLPNYPSQTYYKVIAPQGQEKSDKSLLILVSSCTSQSPELLGLRLDLVFEYLNRGGLVFLSNNIRFRPRGHL